MSNVFGRFLIERHRFGAAPRDVGAVSTRTMRMSVSTAPAISSRE
jgi:hypothetical protein